MQTGYFFVGDILGFKNIVKNLNDNDLSSKMKNWDNFVQKTAKKNKIQNFQLISDTVFAAVGKEKTDLKKLIDFARDLLNGISQSLPIRGAIVYGKYEWGKVVFGEAVIDAYELEKKEKWIGVIIDSAITLSEEDYNDMNIVVYPPPMPENYMRNYRSISWDIPRFDDLSKIMASGGLMAKDEGAKWDHWGDKIGNTVLFSLYIKVLKKLKKPRNVFHGRHPVDFLDLNFHNLLSVGGQNSSDPATPSDGS